MLAKFPDYPKIHLALMCAAMAYITIMELVAVFDPRFVTITQICRSFVPRPIRAFVCLWLFWHMVIAGWLTDKSWVEALWIGAKKIL